MADLFPFPLFLLLLGPYEVGKPDATFSFTDNDFLKIATGKMNPQIAFMRWDHLHLFLLQLISDSVYISYFIKVNKPLMMFVSSIYRGAMKIKGSLSAATKFTPDIFPKPAKM